MSLTIPVLSTYSAGRFIQPFLKQIIAAQPTAALEFADGSKTGEQILNNLVAEMNTVLDAVKANQPVPDGIFKNSSGLYDLPDQASRALNQSWFDGRRLKKSPLKIFLKLFMQEFTKL